MHEITVTSWDHLNQVLYDIPKTPHERYRSNFVYRGVAHKDWGLQTSLMRLGGNYASVEKPLLRSFRKYANPDALTSEIVCDVADAGSRRMVRGWQGGCPQVYGDIHRRTSNAVRRETDPRNGGGYFANSFSGSIWVQIAVAQHHGLPTRLLDWTVSPKVAVHFATFETHHYDKDAAIWCIDVVEARKLLPAVLNDLLIREYAFLFSMEMLEAFPSLDIFDQLAEYGNFVMFFEPPSLDARIVNQGAIMAVMPGATRTLDALLAAHPHLCKRIIIPKDLKWEIRDKLDQDNITERILFPGLDGLSAWLKRYYGQGPTAQAATPATQQPPLVMGKI